MNASCLPLLVAQHLSHEPCSGYTLVKHIQQETGWKPSYGSIYPLLKELESKGLIAVHPEGRRKLYNLTAQGREFFKEQKTQREHAFHSIAEQLRVLASLGDPEAASLAEALTVQRTGSLPLQEIPEVIQMRKEVLRLIKEGKVEQHRKQIAALFSGMAKELRAL